MMSVADSLAVARRMSSLSTREAAILAGVAPSTVTRIESGEMDPTVGTLEKILAACGWRYDPTLQPYMDMDAVRAARRILEPKVEISATVGSEAYADRWQLAGIAAAEDVALAAGRQAQLSERKGAVRFGFSDWRAVARSLRDSGRTWALTGACAALAYTKVASVDWAVFYVDDVVAAASEMELPPADGGRTWTTLIPFDEVTAVGVQTLDAGVRLAGFWQIVIDCFAGNGRMPAQAESMVGMVET